MKKNFRKISSVAAIGMLLLAVGCGKKNNAPPPQVFSNPTNNNGSTGYGGGYGGGYIGGGQVIVQGAFIPLQSSQYASAYDSLANITISFANVSNGFGSQYQQVVGNATLTLSQQNIRQLNPNYYGQTTTFQLSSVNPANGQPFPGSVDAAGNLTLQLLGIIPVVSQYGIGSTTLRDVISVQLGGSGQCPARVNAVTRQLVAPCVYIKGSQSGQQQVNPYYPAPGIAIFYNANYRGY